MIRARLVSAVFAAALTAAFAGSMIAQAPVDLGKRTAKSKYTLGRVNSMRELPDGRIVVADAKEGIFRLVDLTKGDVGVIGKQGDGADEYRSAGAVLPLAGDSMLLYDRAGRKFLHLAPNGTVAAIVPFPTTPTRFINATALDASGTFYYASFRIDTAAKTSTTSLSRWHNGAPADEELFRLNSRRADQTKLNGFVPFAFRDFWGVREDGLVARVTSDTYQVTWYRDGKVAGSTGAIPYPAIAVTPAEQQAIRDSLAQMIKSGPGGAGQSVAFGKGAAGGSGAPVQIGDLGGGVRTVVLSGGGGGVAGVGFAVGAAGGAPVGAGTAPMGPQTMTAADSQRMKDMMAQMAKSADVPTENFPVAKPALPSSGTNVLMFDANGMLWVPREHARGDVIPHYDIIAEGKGVVARVNLPSGTRLVGFGKNAVYLARTEDGSDWIERYPMPKM